LNKKSYFFTLDAMLSFGILILGSFLIFTSYITVPSRTQTAGLAEDVLDFFTTTKIEELNDPYAGIGGTLWQQGLITNEDNTLLQQLGEFYYQYELNSDESFKIVAEQFTISITDNLIPPQFKFEFWIESLLIHPSSPSQLHIDSKDKTKILIPSKEIIFGIFENDLFGPYETEVLIWQ